MDSPARWPSASEKEEKFASNDKTCCLRNVYSDFVRNSYGEFWDSSGEQGKQAKLPGNEVDVNCGNRNLNEEMIIAVVINSNLNHGNDHVFI